MALSPLLRPLGIASSLIATIQALAWSVLTLLGILIYSEVWTPEIGNLSALSLWIYGLFLAKTDVDLMMKADTFIIFISIYFSLSLIWMIISLCKLWVIFRQKWQFAKNTIIAWSILTAIISVLDIITMALFIVDYDYIKDIYDTDITGIFPYHAVSAAGVMMTLAARGFVLLIANIVFTALFAYWGLTFEEQETNNEPKREPINGYESRPAWLGNGNPGGLARPYSNPGYEQEVQERPHSYDRSRYVTSPQSDNFARIGRNNPRHLSPNHQPSYHQPQQQQRERGPYIPEPDYSPTSLRKHPKSVLKSRNHY